MSWIEWIENVNCDEIDREAKERHQLYMELCRINASRKDFIENELDPDGINEFCYYPEDCWDRLIKWAKELYGDEKEPYTNRMLRAGLIFAEIDPDIVVNKEYCRNLDFSGAFFMDLYNHWSQCNEGNVPAFEDTHFLINGINGLITISGPSEEEHTDSNDDFFFSEAKNVEKESKEVLYDDESEWLDMEENNEEEPDYNLMADEFNAYVNSLENAGEEDKYIENSYEEDEYEEDVYDAYYERERQRKEEMMMQQRMAYEEEQQRQWEERHRSW